MEYCDGINLIPGLFYEFTIPLKIQCVIDGGDVWVMRTFRHAQCLEKVSHLGAHLFVGEPIDEVNTYLFLVEVSR